ncbi:hypothetical protein G6F43_007694 [Rhizopus delemar]|nr:hypothetical protein G6F43_007694 [Rhizopus delemar]
MKTQPRIDIRTRKSVRVQRETRFTTKTIATETDKAFIAPELVTVKEDKPEPPTIKNTRSIKDKKVQVSLPFKIVEKKDKKRKIEPEQIAANKKQKTVVNKNEETSQSQQEQVNDKLKETPITEHQNESVFELKIAVDREKEQEQTVEDIIAFNFEDVKSFDNIIIKENHTTHLLSPPRQDSFEKSFDDVPLAQHAIEPMTPPNNQQRHQPVLEAPLRTYVLAADKLRIEDEKRTLEKVQKVLDIILTDRSSRNVPALYSQIETPLRNSTGKSITLSHIRKVMYIAPRLYLMQAKEIRRFGNKTFEDYLIEFAKEWALPLSPKDHELRKELTHDGLKAYFESHSEPDATVPEVALPKLATLVDKKEWIKEAKLPPGVRSLLEAHEKVKEEKIESEKPKPIPKGSVKDRMAALRARLAQKK